MKKIFLIGLVILSACNQKQQDNETKGWQYKDPLTKIMNNNGVQYTITLQTAEQMAYLRAFDSKTQKLDEQRYAEELEQTKDHFYFVITQKGGNDRNVLEQNAGNEEMYAKRYQYYQTDAQQDMWLASCRDTISPDAYLYENNMGVVSENRMVAAFPVGKDTCDIQLIFHDRAFDNYQIRAGYAYKDIQNAPRAKQY
ncbi:MAG: hypothetical protein ACN6O7_00390 [Sphingobacterium sp.]